EIGESTYFGREGVERGVQELLDVFENVQAEPEEFFHAEPHIVVFVRLTGCARGSGVPVEFPLAHVFRFRGGLVDQWHAHADRHTALKAVGLPGEAMSENVEIVRRAIAASTSEAPDVETLRAILDPEHVLITDWGVEKGRHRGVE